MVNGKFYRIFIPTPLTSNLNIALSVLGTSKQLRVKNSSFGVKKLPVNKSIGVSALTGLPLTTRQAECLAGCFA